MTSVFITFFLLHFKQYNMKIIRVLWPGIGDNTELVTSLYMYKNPICHCLHLYFTPFSLTQFLLCRPPDITPSMDHACVFLWLLYADMAVNFSKIILIYFNKSFWMRSRISNHSLQSWYFFFWFKSSSFENKLRFSINTESLMKKAATISKRNGTEFVYLLCHSVIMIHLVSWMLKKSFSGSN